MMTNTALLPSRPPRPSIWANSHWSLGRPSKECINVRHQLLPHQCIQWSWCQAGHIPCQHTLCWSEACSSWKVKAENIFEKIHKMQFELLSPCSQLFLVNMFWCGGVKVTVVVSCVYGEQQERGGEGREEDEVGEGYGHWSTLLQRQRAFSLVLLIIFNIYCCGPWSWLWSMVDDVADH